MIDKRHAFTNQTDRAGKYNLIPQQSGNDNSNDLLVADDSGTRCAIEVVVPDLAEELDRGTTVVRHGRIGNTAAQRQTCWLRTRKAPRFQIGRASCRERV